MVLWNTGLWVAPFWVPSSFWAAMACVWVPGLLLIVIWVLVRPRVRRPSEAARELFENNRALYSRQCEYRQVSPSDFAEIDVYLYDEYAAAFVMSGFQFVTDMENITLSQ